MPSSRPSLRFALGLGLAALLLLAAATACGGDGAEPATEAPATVSREVFVSTYVDLRLAALRDSVGTITTDQRERILAEHGVTPGELVRFVEAHGDDLGYMRDVWNDVDQRIRDSGNAEDSASS